MASLVWFGLDRSSILASPKTTMMIEARRCSADAWRSRLLDYATLFTEEVLSPDLVPELERMIRQDFHGSPAILEYDRAGNLLTQNTIAAVPPAAARAYYSHFHRVNPAPAEVVRRNLLNDAYVLSELVGRERLARTEYFNEFLRPNHIEHMVGFSTALAGFGRASFNVARSRREGDFTPLEAERLNDIRSFFRNATLFRRMHEKLVGIEVSETAAGETPAAEGDGPVPFPIRGAIRLSLETFLRERFSLSPRQAAVAAMLIDGKSYKEIAGSLAISFETVSSHVKAILDRTGAESSRRLAALVRDRWNE